MKFTSFISKKKAEAFTDTKDSEKRILISITTPGESRSTGYCREAILHMDAWRDVLRLKFHDVEPELDGYDYVIFSHDDVKKIFDFLKKHEDEIDEVVVHCEAGISRSAAVSKFIAVIYGLEFPENYMLYNRNIFSTLMRLYGEAFYDKGILPKDLLPAIQGEIA
jgi:predicted protein tyrosine phosphatase